MTRPRPAAWIAILVFAILVTGCIIAVWTFISEGNAMRQRDEARARATLVAYLDLVRQRKWIKACDMQDDTSDLAMEDCEGFLSSGAPLVSFDVGGARSTSWNTEGTFIKFPVSLVYADGSHEQIELEVGSKARGYPDTVLDGPISHTRERPYEG
ncbi:hypothetical protein [Actinomadura sp. K4S16]|uniref:hypothetical protein n=1 Tax=Actinomadura sp. K4S16 TaxID=1316147 RepID=UPI0011EE53EB|nr:hypothetical protein [Actinomadura sp. K4S16]